jgi:hypothetical protein
MSPGLLPWWGWLVAAVFLWLIALFTDEDKHFFLRMLLVIGIILSALIGVIRFVKWVWNG